jgi:hypothetical protein
MTARLDHVSAAWARDLRIGDASFLLRPGKRHMRVKLCSRCPYTPRDLAGHYDPEGVLHVCAKCDGEHGASTSRRRHKAHRRQRCVTAPNIPVTAQSSVARSATENLASYGTTPAKPLSVQRSALTASRHAGKATADGYAGFTPPDNGGGEVLAAFFRNPGFRSREPTQ